MKNTEIKYFTNKDYVLRKIAGENVLISVGGAVADFSGIITLNETATYIWNALQKGSTKEALYQSLMDEYEAEESVIKNDVDEMMDILFQKGMITHE